MTVFNIFRVLGDLSHIASKIVLMWSIHWNRSAEVSIAAYDMNKI
jgi:ER lumen protein retaining receptor